MKSFLIIIITCRMNFIDLPKQACFTPIYSPRTSLSKTNSEMERLATNLAINIDKYILGFFKDAFEQNNNELTLNQFISQGIKHLKSWQRQLKYRNQKIHLCLNRLFQQADSNGKGLITWTQFNSMLIQKGLNLKSLRNQQPGNTALMKPINLHGTMVKHGNNPIQKMVCIGTKIALFLQESKQINFFNVDGSPSTIKPLYLNQQQLTVETSISKRNKVGHKEIIKKDLVVAQYKNIILDMIYINDSKYNMLITSSTDFMIRGWDISSNIPSLAKQPQNQDQKMQHQFPTQIHTMAWDNVNQILYCCGKSPVIYEWMVKTDSQRQLTDPDAHTEMISSMIMMPKLQFLATGGYDGKLILWDTISQTKKFKYKEHTRSIASMTFHQGLILLFTSAYDHSICVWNPYIQSLIHKIISNNNFIQLDIIPDSNMLIALDIESNVMIREINKFSLVSSFSIDKHENKIEPSCMISTQHPLRYFFGGFSVAAFQYVHIDANVIQDSPILCLEYDPSTFILYSPVKNHIVAWDLLTGNVSNTLRNQTSGEITAFGMFTSSKIAVIGDSQGNLLMRKLQNGVLIKKLFKHKTSITVVLVQQLQEQRIIFSASYDGQVAIFDRDRHGDFNHYRNISIKKMSPSANITALCYQDKRNTLMIGTNTGEIFFIDIDKNKMISKCQSKAGEIQSFVYLEKSHILLSFTKKTEILGLFLPPHLKKFKPSCHLISEQTNTKITSVAMSVRNKRCYIGFQNGDLMCFWLSQDVIADSSYEDEEQSQMIRHVWKTNLGETVRNVIWIQSQDILIVVAGNNKIILKACQSGDHIAQMSERYLQTEPPPILFLDQQSDSVYIKEQDHSIAIKTKSEEQQIRRLFDPSFYLSIAEPYREMIKLESNPNWKFHPKIEDQTEKTIQNTIKLLNRIKMYENQPRKLKFVKAQSQSTSVLNKANELSKQWERQKEEEDVGRATKQQSLHMHNASSGSFRYSNKSQNFKDSKMHSAHYKSMASQNPLFKLGMALKSVNDKDKKAQKLLQMAQNSYTKGKGSLKLPKISNYKGTA